MKVYVDGCSYTAGYGLDKKFSLANIISRKTGWQVSDFSFEGKSNYAMALDLYKSAPYDIYVIGWTFHARIEYNLDDIIVQGSPSRNEIRLNTPSGEFCENEYKELNSRFFKYINRFNVLSDFLIDSSALLLNDKKYCFFSWESRNVNTNLLRPLLSKEFRQKDTVHWETTGHLTEQGMNQLSDIVLTKLNE